MYTSIYVINSTRTLWQQLWKYLGNVAVFMDAAAQCMLDMPSDDNTQYLTTKSFLKSAQWKFAHKSENSQNLNNIPIVTVVVRDNQYQAQLSGMNFVIIDAHCWDNY
jgi:hypothetical protein